MSKQTAMQWFKDVMYPYLDKESKEYVDILFNHALKMEREQIIDAYNNGDLRSADLYYKETYGDHSVDDNKMIDHNGDVNEMVGGQDE